jgi:hypothetical protein
LESLFFSREDLVCSIVLRLGERMIRFLFGYSPPVGFPPALQFAFEEFFACALAFLAINY